MKSTSVDSSSPTSARGRSTTKAKGLALVVAAPDSSEARKPAARKVTSRKTATPTPTPVAPGLSPNIEEVRQMIATAAYYRALQRDFEAGHEQEDWLMAEREISRMLASGVSVQGIAGQ
jgi:hypothetical protein